jgi:phosphoglycolate phosphatase
MKKKKLVIFDIDGTLILANQPQAALQRFRYSLQDVFGVDIGEITADSWKSRNFNGRGDRYNAWAYLKDTGVSRDIFLDKLGAVGDAFVTELDRISEEQKHIGPLYTLIPQAKQLLDSVIAADHLSEGTLTGNLGPSANWKLASVGLPTFGFGVYGHEADEREDLARLLVSRTKKYFKHEYTPEDIVFVGDTVHDVSCARAVGAKVIIVSTGWNVHKDEFAANPPDLHVDTLMDTRVLAMLGLD